MQACSKCLFEALPKYREEQLVDLLEFVAAQHSGRNFNPDNSSKALDICNFLRRRPFAASPAGVAAIARLARHALGSSTGDQASAEHKLWLLTSGALNTAAAIRAHNGDALAFFDALQHDASVRGRYLQRQYATKAMQEHVESPNAYFEEEDPDALLKRKMAALRPFQLFFAALLLALAIFIGIVGNSERSQRRLLEKVRPLLGYTEPLPDEPLFS